MKLSIQLLNRNHERTAFSCGETSLDRYLQRYAMQDMKRRVNRVFVASPANQVEEVIGYYSLSACSLDAENLPEDRRTRLPQYPLPVALLGRLAIASSHHREGIGSVLLADALSRVSQASQVMAVYALLVDALDERAADFYQQFGFIPLPSQPLKLFLPMDSVSGHI